MTGIHEDIRQWLSTHQLPYNGARNLLQRISATGGIPGSVWLAGKYDRPDTEIPGVFSAPDTARAACQDVANEYFGAKNTPPLNWRGDDEYASTSYSDPTGSYFFHVTRFTVDEIREDTS